LLRESLRVKIMGDKVFQPDSWMDMEEWVGALRKYRDKVLPVDSLGVET
jgi:hypothetical protein